MSKVITEINDFASMQPDLLEEWDINKNTLDPRKIGQFSNKKAFWICKRCGNSWEAIISSRSKGRGCPKCNSEKNTSFGEQAIYFYFSRLGINVENRYKLHKKYEIDIFIPDLKIGIEYDGYFWHKDKKTQDAKKDLIMQQEGIKLYRIKEIKKISEKDNVDSSIIYYLYDSGNNLSLAIKELFSKIGVRRPDTFIDVVRDYSKINKFYKKSLKSKSLLCKPDYLMDFNYEKNAPIIPENLYLSSGKKIWWKCHVCGTEYFRSPNEISAGCKCPKCSHEKRVNSLEKKLLKKNGSLGEKNPDFLKEWDYNKNDISPFDITLKSNKKVYWVCSKCGNRWQATPYNRSQGKGCKECGKKIIGKKKSKKVEQYTINNEYIQTFDSLTEARLKTGAKKISEVCSGKRKSSGGYIWKYKE